MESYIFTCRQAPKHLSKPTTSDKYGGKPCWKSGAWDLVMRHNSGSGEAALCRCEENLRKLIWKQHGRQWNLHQLMAELLYSVQFPFQRCCTRWNLRSHNLSQPPRGVGGLLHLCPVRQHWCVIRNWETEKIKKTDEEATIDVAKSQQKRIKKWKVCQ